jgi:hypothetical protein
MQILAPLVALAITDAAFAENGLTLLVKALVLRDLATSRTIRSVRPRSLRNRSVSSNDRKPLRHGSRSEVAIRQRLRASVSELGLGERRHN